MGLAAQKGSLLLEASERIRLRVTSAADTRRLFAARRFDGKCAWRLEVQRYVDVVLLARRSF